MRRDARGLDVPRELDRVGMSARNVNDRAVLHSIFVYAMKPDTYVLPSNPVAATDKRCQPPRHRSTTTRSRSWMSLARACERGEHRTAPPSYRGRPNALGDDEQAARTAEDCQDAELFRVTFCSGMRIGELVALRWRYVRFLPDLSGAVINVERAVSAGVEKEPEGRRGRQMPIPRPAAEAPARLGQRDHFTGAEDCIFCSRLGRRLDPSASAVAKSAPPRPPACARSSSTACATRPAPSSPARCPS
jgi:integrase